MSVNVLYQTAARATGGRDGRSATVDGTFAVSLTIPKELGGPGGDGANPEKLFAAGYAACFLGAMKFVASQGGPKVPSDATVTATVGIGPLRGKQFKQTALMTLIKRPRKAAEQSNSSIRRTGSSMPHIRPGKPPWPHRA
jgi:osmotically inducible protein OsmC